MTWDDQRDDDDGFHYGSIECGSDVCRGLKDDEDVRLDVFDHFYLEISNLRNMDDMEDYDFVIFTLAVEGAVMNDGMDETSSLIPRDVSEEKSFLLGKDLGLKREKNGKIKMQIKYYLSCFYQKYNNGFLLYFAIMIVTIQNFKKMASYTL